MEKFEIEKAQLEAVNIGRSYGYRHFSTNSRIFSGKNRAGKEAICTEIAVQINRFFRYL